MIIRRQAHPRAALIGNPSDGYYGRTIAFTFKNFAAAATLFESPELRIEPGERDVAVYRSQEDMLKHLRRFGYYGGVRLLQAAVKRFHEHCETAKIKLPRRNFTLRYETTIPPHLGLAGSSAIITACFRALMEFFQVEIDNPILANLVLETETVELGLAAGLQDRVAQAYDRPMVMDFDRELMEKQGYGAYTELSSALLPPLYIAFRRELSEGSELVHNNLRYRFQKGEPEVLAAMRTWAELTRQAHQMLLAGQGARLGELLNQNFDLRRRICAISRGNVEMVETARSTGASAKFTGSGGAIIGTYDGEAMYERLAAALGNIGVEVIKPIL